MRSLSRLSLTEANYCVGKGYEGLWVKVLLLWLTGYLLWAEMWMKALIQFPTQA